MPDLQSELNKILASHQFDDDKGSKPAVVVTDTPKGVVDTTEDGNLRARAWNYIKQNPGATVGEIAAALNTKTPALAGGLHKMVVRGNLTREHRADGSGYHYNALGDSYVVLSVEERVEMMHKARAQRRAAETSNAKPKKSKAKPIKWVADKPKAPAPAAFDADAILANLNVLQARELMDKLRKLFGV